MLHTKLKYAIKASLSVSLAFIIAFSQGLEQATTAAVTIVLIATIGTLGDSIMKGWMRIVGTIIGATLGLILVINFPQSREIYLLIASIMVTLSLYLARAYKGDLAVYLLGTITFLFMFQGGNVESAFMYGVTKTFMTVIGIVIYTLISVTLWPVNIVNNSIDNVLNSTNSALQLYRLRDDTKDKRVEAHQALLASKQLLKSSIIDITDISSNMSFTEQEWTSIVFDYKNIDELLTLLSLNNKENYPKDISVYIKNYEILDTNIEKLLENLSLAWDKQKSIEIPKNFELEYNKIELHYLSPLKQSSLVATMQQMQKLHLLLSKLASKINSVLSPSPTLFELEDIPKTPLYLWFDIEHLKGSLVTLMVFWVSTIFWIQVNPPGGFIIVILATALSVLTTFTPFKPSILMIIFAIGFVFATFMYIFVLPQLHYGWELALFVFFYAFIGFYFFSPLIAPFFILSIVSLFLSNEMSYNFDLFLMFLFMFYAFLSVLLIFYYIPFSTKPERLFLLLRERFFKLAKYMVKGSRGKHHSFYDKILIKYSTMHLMSTAKKMQLWASKIDNKYFDNIDKGLLLSYTKDLEVFAYLLHIMIRDSRKAENNTIVKNYFLEHKDSSLYEILDSYTSKKEPIHVDHSIEKLIEARLKEFLPPLSSSKYTKDETIEFYENISIRRDVWLSLLELQKVESTIDFTQLNTNRF